MGCEPDSGVLRRLERFSVPVHYREFWTGPHKRARAVQREIRPTLEKGRVPSSKRDGKETRESGYPDSIDGDST
jgi:hypothetical protein